MKRGSTRSSGCALMEACNVDGGIGGEEKRGRKREDVDGILGF